MKAINQSHPKLYLSIYKSSKDEYNVEYYQNQYNKQGNLKILFGQIPSSLISGKKSLQSNLYKLNKAEHQCLINVINKQKKVLELYSKKNKQDQFNTINSSLQLMLEYEYFFSKWFSDNREF